MKIIKDIIDVLHEKDLKSFLEDIGKYNEFINNKIQCIFCNDPVNYNNIYGFFFKGDEIEFICTKEICYNEYRICSGEEINE